MGITTCANITDDTIDCDQCGENATIAGGLSSWKYSVMEGCGWDYQYC